MHGMKNVSHSQGIPVPVPVVSSADNSFIGGGEAGRIVRSKDWSGTPLGPIESWPSSLRTAVSIVLNSNFPIALAWGPGHVQLYNDGYRVICAGKHPSAMGQDFSECWASAFPVIGDAFRSALAGTTAFLEDQRMFLDRLGYLEETFFTFSFSPIRDECGAVVGLFHPVTETTGKMVSQRRVRTLRDLNASGLECQSLDDALQRISRNMADAALDVPFALLYRLDEERTAARLSALAGLVADRTESPELVDLKCKTQSWPIAQVVATGVAVTLSDLRERFPGLTCGPYPEPMAAARVLPISPAGQNSELWILIVGLSSRLPLNEAYTSFHELLGSTVGNVLSSALSAEAERRRIEALAEIDRAKTVFFSNISHEFRTPLTLMLGPLEDELAERIAPLPAPRRERLEIVQRNSLRLLKLVNALLDFSRLEAGRAQANYQATELATFTTELAGVFRSAIEKAGLTLTVDCPPLSEPVFVDRDMWEKIVLNLLSNALKHTFAGDIRVSLRELSGQIELQVTDTGVGIPTADLPRLFERFHRVKGARARSHEGTGIGLALVQELTLLHRGGVRVTSEEGQGSTFSVTLPSGRAHLPEAQVAAAPRLALSRSSIAHVEEALQWIPAEIGPAAAPIPRNDVNPVPLAEREHVVWADDNSDMRDYVRRLLSDHYQVTAVCNGVEAVDVVRRTLPDLVLSDVMMPGLDGFGVLRELRADLTTRHIPVILLSARAGEEAAIGGLDAGADDYLVKPFAARELLARVRTHVGLAKLRREHGAALERAAELARKEAEGRVLLENAGAHERTLIGLLEDQQRAEAALRASTEELHQLAEAMPQIVWITRADGWNVFFNRQWMDYTGLTLEESRGENWSKPFHPSDRPRAELAWRKAVETRGSYVVECRLRRADGHYRWWLIRGVPFLSPSGEVLRWFGTCTDIDDLKQAEQAVRESEEKFRQIAENIHEVFWVYDVSARSVLYISPAFGTILGRPTPSAPEDPRALLAVVHPEDRARVRESVAAYTMTAGAGEDFRIVRPDGGVRFIRAQAFPVRDVRGAVTRVVGTVEDLTESRELEERLRQSQKLEAIGTLAGGIAHDFNNILTGIAGFTTLARSALGNDAEVLDCLGEIGMAGQRASDLVGQILAFSRVGDPGLVPVQLRDVVGEAVKLMRAAIPSTIEFEIELAPNLPVVQGNPTQLHQILMNLGTNAWHAMGDRPGKLGVRLDATCVDELQARALSDISPGPFLRLTVSDTGCGMDSATCARAFEPFFTTKGPGKGTGLGLSVVHGIVRGHRGAIRLSSSTGKGTTFEIFLPAKSAERVKRASAPSDPPRGHGERILFVDDESQLTRLAERTLRQLGYAPICVPGGTDALARLEHDPLAFSLVITDQTMPGFTGLELATRIHLLRPQLPIVLASGMTLAVTEDGLQSAGICAVLQKPYTVAELATAIRRHVTPALLA